MPALGSQGGASAGGMDMMVVQDQLGEAVMVGQRGPYHPGFASRQAAHGVVQMGEPDSSPDRPYGLDQAPCRIVGSRAVTDADAYARLCEAGGGIDSMGNFRGQGHQPYDIQLEQGFDALGSGRNRVGRLGP